MTTSSLASASFASATAHYEALFHASSLDLVVPNTPALISPPANPDDHPAWSTWWELARGAEQRHTAFFDEKLAYVLGLSIPDQVVEGGRQNASVPNKTPPDLVRFISRLQVSLSASFLPPIAGQRQSFQSNNDRQSIGLGAPPSSASSSLAPPVPPRAPQTPNEERNFTLPPVTPNPFPSMAADESVYANVEGIVVWEGSPSDPISSPPLSPSHSKSESQGQSTGHPRSSPFGVPEVFHARGTWTILWRGEVPIAYVRTPISEPVLGVTASITLREQVVNFRKQRAMSLETASIHSDAETVRGDAESGTDVEKRTDIGDLAGIHEVDLLSGLAGEPLPSTRLPPSLRTELSLPAQPRSLLIPTISPSTVVSASIVTPVPLLSSSSTMTALRKSFRRIFSLSSGLRVRMRTLFLPQLLPPRLPDGLFAPDDILNNVAPNANDDSGPGGGEDHEGEGERRVVLCVEVENAAQPPSAGGDGSMDDLTRFGFEVERVAVEIGGKGGRATAELTCQPEEAGVFPLRLAPLEQYNLLYVVSLASGHEAGALDEAIARTTGRGDEQRPVSITLIGRPFSVLLERGQLPHEGTFQYPTSPFQSRWNCTLDLAPLYASLPLAAPNALPSARPHISVPAIAGDRRYSLAALLSDKDGNSGEILPVSNTASSLSVHSGANVNRRIVSAQQKPQPMLPSQAMGNQANRIASLRQSLTLPPSRPDGHGLLVSVQIIAPPAASFANAATGSGPGINGFNKMASDIKAFDTFSIEVFVNNRTDLPRRFNLSIPPTDAKVKRIREAWHRRHQESGSLSEDPTPALVPLETDVRCGPLLPGASLSARIRFLALRDGVHRIERLKVIGEEFNFTISPVADVVVGSGIE